MKKLKINKINQTNKFRIKICPLCRGSKIVYDSKHKIDIPCPKCQSPEKVLKLKGGIK